MKKRALVVFGMLLAVALVIVGAVETHAEDPPDVNFECEGACAIAYWSALDGCRELGGRDRVTCRKEAKAAAQECLAACAD